jgi:hypothetical protein
MKKRSPRPSMAVYGAVYTRFFFDDLRDLVSSNGVVHTVGFSRVVQLGPLRGRQRRPPFGGGATDGALLAALLMRPAGRGKFPITH